MRSGAELAGLPLPAVLAKLDTSPRGLTGEQARARLEQFGPNEIAEKRTSLVLVLLSYFWGADPVDDRGRVKLATYWWLDRHPQHATASAEEQA